MSCAVEHVEYVYGTRLGIPLRNDEAAKCRTMRAFEVLVMGD